MERHQGAQQVPVCAGLHARHEHCFNSWSSSLHHTFSSLFPCSEAPSQLHAREITYAVRKKDNGLPIATRSIDNMPELLQHSSTSFLSFGISLRSFLSASRLVRPQHCAAKRLREMATILPLPQLPCAQRAAQPASPRSACRAERSNSSQVNRDQQPIRATDRKRFMADDLIAHLRFVLCLLFKTSCLLVLT